MEEKITKQRAINDRNLRILRKAVYDYTNCNGITMPERDRSYFNSVEMLRPFDNIPDKVNSIINTFKVYCRASDFKYILKSIKQESLLGQAIYLLMNNNYEYDEYHNLTFKIDKQDIPITFGNLMVIYANAGYDVSLLKDFLVKLYEEYYPKS